LATLDTLVCNKAARRFVDSCSKLKSEDKMVVEYSDLGHMIMHDKRYLGELTQEIMQWFD
jgi:alpha-beta hydrolase superfamily lysophospholipase